MRWERQQRDPLGTIRRLLKRFENDKAMMRERERERERSNRWRVNKK